jgi:hypothetical protein
MFIYDLVPLLRGAPGASGLTTDLLRDLCRARGKEAGKLCVAIAALVRRIATSRIPEGHLGPHNVNRLAALDKGKGEVRPVGIGEALRRLVCKAIARVTQEEVREACGAMQLCGGMPSGCEAGARAIQELWDDPEVEAVLFIDARNAFNTMNRAEAIRTATERCPIIARALKNIYGTPSSLCLEDGSHISSKEGTTQGCPLGMVMFALSSLPLIARVAVEGLIQIWYADDSAGAGKVEGLRRWYQRIEEEGPQRGYHIKLSKTVALVKPHASDKFLEAFSGLTDPHNGGMRVISGTEGPLGTGLGERYLGAGVGDREFREQYVRGKVSQWVKEIETLSKFAKTDPHEAYCLTTQSSIHRWRYVMRAMKADPEWFAPLEQALASDFCKDAFGWQPDTSALRTRVALPLRHAGLGLNVATQMAEDMQGGADHAVEDLVQAIKQQDWHYTVDPKEIRKTRRETKKIQEGTLKGLADSVEKELEGEERHIMREMRLPGSDRSICAIPRDGSAAAYDRQTFRDHMAIRMGLPCPDPLPEDCPRCGEEDIDRNHLLNCKTQGRVTRRHGEVQRAWAKLMKLACRWASLEPLMGGLGGPAFEKGSTTTDKEARGDILARGVFQDQVESLFDVVVVNTFKESARKKGLKPATILRIAEGLKRAEYEERARRAGQTFTPLASSILGTLGPEAEQVLLTLCAKICNERGGDAKAIELHARMTIQAATIKATSLCLRAHPETSQSCVHGEKGVENESATEDDFRVLQEELGNPFRD